MADAERAVDPALPAVHPDRRRPRRSAHRRGLGEVLLRLDPLATWRWSSPFAIALATFAIWFAAGFSQIDENLLDAAQGTSLPDPSGIPVVIVDVDDATTQALGYPYSRSIYARLLDILHRGGARWVVFDFVFDTKRRNQDGSPLYPGEDEAFAQALERHPNTTLSGQIPSSETDVGVVRMRTVEAKTSIVALPEFLAHAPRWGSVQTKTETDITVRVR